MDIFISVNEDPEGYQNNELYEFMDSTFKGAELTKELTAAEGALCGEVLVGFTIGSILAGVVANHLSQLIETAENWLATKSDESIRIELREGGKTKHIEVSGTVSLSKETLQKVIDEFMEE